VSALLESEALHPILDRAPRGLVADAVRSAIDAARRDPSSAPRDPGEWAAAVSDALEQRERRSLRPLFNGTGVVLHTNLGRAPLAAAALHAIHETAAGFCNLEYDVELGERGSRYAHCVALLTELTGAEDAIVVNNCAAALVLTLNVCAEGKEAIVSRGELIEIGGSFRIPDIMAKSGATLVEVGTTNRTHLDDYRRAIGERTGAIVKVHRSNFTVDGFVAEVSLRELAPVAEGAGVPLLSDFGSGLLLSLEPWGLRGEPTAAEEVRGGATCVLMSGDKLLGGPQAGIIVGKRDTIARLRANPLARALRVDKLTLAALEATLALYRDPERAVRDVPALAMLTASLADVRDRAVRFARALSSRGIGGDIVASEATVGGGAFPTARIPSVAVALHGDAAALERRLRAGEVAVVGRVAGDRLLLDLRSVPAAQDAAFAAAVIGTLA